MVKVPDIGDPVASLVHGVYEERREDWRREHLGASGIGQECSRKIWYEWRWAVERRMPGRVLRLLERGNREEDWVADDLRAAGIVIETVDPDTVTDENPDGSQWRFAWRGGHFGGSCDGLIRSGVPGASKSMHVFECKTANAKYFKEISTKGVRKAKPEHYAQMQIYMLGFRMRGIKVSRALYVVVSKNDDSIYSERVHFDEGEASSMLSKAESILTSDGPPSRISDDPTFYVCNWCDYRGVCHLDKVEDIERNCRTCTSSTPRRDGVWTCDHLHKRLDVHDQRRGCQYHVLNPMIVPWEAEDADIEGRRVYYRDRSGVQFVDTGGRIVVRGEED